MVSDFVSGAVEFDSAITRSGIFLRLTKEGTDQLRESVKELSNTQVGGIFSHQQTALALQAIADEGRGVDGTMRILSSAMNMAAVSGDDLAQTADELETLMSAYNLTIEDTERISDVLINTQFETGTAMNVLMPAISQMGQTLHTLGLSFEETTAIIGTMKDKSVSQISGITLAIQQMAQGTGNGAKLMEEFGITVKDSAGNLKPILQIFEEMTMAGITAQDMVLSFGRNTANAMGVVINKLDEVKDSAESNLEATGLAAESAAQFMESDAAEAAAFETAMEDLKLELAEGVLPVLTDLLEILRPLIDFLTENTEVIYALVAAFTVYKVALAVYTITQWAANIAAYAFPGTWIALAIMAIILAIVLLIVYWDEVTQAIKDTSAAIMNLLGPAIDFGKEKIQEFIDLILMWFDIHKRMYEFGADAINAFIDGLVDAVAGAAGPLGDAAGTISGYFGGSLPETGPLQHIHEMGRELGTEYIRGIGELDTVALSDSAGTFAPSPTPPVSNVNTTNEGDKVTNNYYLVDSEDFMGMIEKKLAVRIGVSNKATNKG